MGELFQGGWGETVNRFGLVAVEREEVYGCRIHAEGCEVGGVGGGELGGYRWVQGPGADVEGVREGGVAAFGLKQRVLPGAEAAAKVHRPGADFGAPGAGEIE